MQELEYKSRYETKGYLRESIAGVIFLIVGVGIAVVMLTFTGVLAGQTYQLTESKIDAITNTTVQEAVKSSIVSGFEGLQTAGDYLPLIVLALVTAIVMVVIFASMGSFTGMGGGGSVL